MSKAVILTIGTLLVICACGTSGHEEPPPPPPPPVSVTITPETAILNVKKTVQFAVIVRNATNSAVTWSLSGDTCTGAECGTISDGGLYTAPESVSASPFPVIVTATSVADSSKSASAILTVLAAMIIRVSPQDIFVSAGASRDFGALVENFVSSNQVTFSLSGSGGAGPEYGTISTEGMNWNCVLYAAPAVPPTDPIVTLTATSVEDPAVSISTTATIRPAGYTNVMWTWVSGSDVGGQSGIYGIKGVADPSNVPGSRSKATTWLDQSGNLWIFGGISSTVGGGTFNDLWKYDTTTHQWTWVSGSDVCGQVGIYGTKGVADPLNAPGSRHSALSWSDPSGKLWLFGGEGFDSNPTGGGGRLNDLWFFDLSTYQWTWVSGSSAVGQLSVYGTKGVPDVTNIPGARLSSASWIDSSGKLWLFGGWGYTNIGGFYRLNDLWRFDPATSEWTWVSGTDQSEDLGEYGTKGIPSISNRPWARGNATTWIDGNGKFWLFGGFTWPLLEYRWIFNDLWRFDPESLEWTWISGSEWPNELGYYGTKGIPDARNIPGARAGCASWIDSDGNFWLFGGTGYHSESYGLVLNDLWRFDPKILEWTWEGGSDFGDQRGFYGTKNVGDLLNLPEARVYSSFWYDVSGRFWLFGGDVYDPDPDNCILPFNDLWHFVRIPPVPNRVRTYAYRH